MKHLRWKKIFAVLLISSFLVLIALPWALKVWINRELGEQGHIEQIRLNPFLLKISALGINLHLNEGQTQVAIRQLDFSFDGSELIRGRLAGDLWLMQPQVVWTPASPTAKPPKEPRTPPELHQSLRRWIPFVLQNLGVEDGRLRLILKPAPLEWDRIDLAVTNLATRERRQHGAAQIRFHGVLAKTGIFRGDGSFYLLDPWPEGRIQFKLTDLPLKSLNPWLRNWASVDAEAGELSLTGEVATSIGKMEGYVKPLLKHVDFTKDRSPKPSWKKTREHLAQGASAAFKSLRSGKVATKINFEGDLRDPQVDLWSIFSAAAENALGAPIQPEFDRTIKTKPKLPKP